MLLATKWVNVFGHFRPIFEQKNDPELSRSHFFSKRIHQKKIQLKILIFSKYNDGATWWPNSYKNFLACCQHRNTQMYQRYVRLLQAFFLEFRTCSSQQRMIINNSWKFGNNEIIFAWYIPFSFYHCIVMRVPNAKSFSVH